MPLQIGDPAPWFTLPSSTNPTYHFDTVGGYRTLLFFFGRASQDGMSAVLQQFVLQQERFADYTTPFFGISIDPQDTGWANEIRIPSYCKFLWDFEGSVSQLYGCSPTPDPEEYHPITYVLDENLHVLHVFPLTATEDEPEDYVKRILDYVATLSPPAPPRLADRQAPVLFIPRVFDDAFCQTLIQSYHQQGGRASGFMRQIDGKTVEVFDPYFKQRCDWLIQEPQVITQVNNVVLRRVKPEVKKVFQYSISRFERYLVACYESQNQGFFNRHRDNSTKGTAHRRFAMTVNLNSDYDGGCLRFPEYGTQLYRPHVGEAVIFSCSLLHEATAVTRGQRFAFLSFFYDDIAAQERQLNRPYLAVHGADQEEAEQNG